MNKHAITPHPISPIPPEVGIAVASGATVAPALDEAAQIEFIRKAQDLAPSTAPSC